ncbi:MAG: hypothetical protein M0P58_12275 [Bacteroidales bacterium]|jgi:hypothetical protein|nr:hypothetical protein [Bacteroidales bacterium]
MKERWIIGIQITDRIHDVSELQAILTKFGCSIKTRLGLHEVQGDFCSMSGLILLELTGNQEEYIKLEKELHKLDGLVVKKMIFIE